MKECCGEVLEKGVVERSCGGSVESVGECWRRVL